MLPVCSLAYRCPSERGSLRAVARCFRFVAFFSGWALLSFVWAWRLSFFLGAVLASSARSPPDFWVDRELCFPGGGWLLRSAVAFGVSPFSPLAAAFVLPSSPVGLQRWRLCAPVVVLRACRAGRLLAGFRCGAALPFPFFRPAFRGVVVPYGVAGAFVARLSWVWLCGFCCCGLSPLFFPIVCSLLLLFPAPVCLFVLSVAFRWVLGAVPRRQPNVTGLVWRLSVRL